jgi:hypothetical protein
VKLTVTLVGRAALLMNGLAVEGEVTDTTLTESVKLYVAEFPADPVAITL